MKLDVLVPTIGESITEAVIGEWLIEDGDYVDADQEIVRIESEKATVDINAEKSGAIKFLVEAGETVEIGAKIAEINTEAEKPEQESKPESEPEPEPDKPKVDIEKPVELERRRFDRRRSDDRRNKYNFDADDGTHVRVTPLAKTIMEKEGVDPNTIKPSEEGKITKDDVLNTIESKKEDKPTTEKDKSEKVPELNLTFDESSSERKERREKMTLIRKTISKRLLEAKQETAMLTTFNEVDMTKVLEMKKEFSDSFMEKYGFKMGFMGLFLKAASIALSDYPMVNASIDGDEIVYRDYTDISVAVSSPRGLVVPVVRNVNALDIPSIEGEIYRLATKARAGKLTVDEMSGGTFTVTNGGVFGSLLSTPLVNYPQVAILGMHTIQDRPIAINKEVVVKPMMYIALSYDHRLIDGETSVKFLKRVKELIENPARLLYSI